MLSFGPSQLSRDAQTLNNYNSTRSCANNPPQHKQLNISISQLNIFHSTLETIPESCLFMRLALHSSDCFENIRLQPNKEVNKRWFNLIINL